MSNPAARPAMPSVEHRRSRSQIPRLETGEDALPPSTRPEQLTPSTRLAEQLPTTGQPRKASKTRMRKVSAEEIFDIQALRKVYNNPDRTNEAVLRVFHVQNADWATEYLLRKFNIDNRDGLVGNDFGKYVRHKNPERRGGRPFLNGKTWKVQYDPWRGISKTSFGLDYLKQYNKSAHLTGHHRRSAEDDTLKMMELDSFGDEDNPAHGYDVYVQRLSCYVQHKQTPGTISLPMEDSDIKNPYHIEDNQAGDSPEKRKDVYIPRLNTLDNGNAILIFDNSHTGCLDDTLIPPRQTWEERWRRLPFFLAFESKDLVESDEQLAYHSTRIILDDIFKVLTANWDSFLNLAMDHVNDVESDDTWLESLPGDFERLGTTITEDLIKPTENLISLLYQSVSIRDSRHSIQLNVSMWRLSWITFIFLPMTFITGFFGMNVDTFKDDPSIKWYFIATVPFMLIVLILWYIIKHYLAGRRQTPHQRGIYENFFNEMANENPSLWSRMGPRDYVVPDGILARLKWRFIKTWSAPERTILMDTDGSDGSGGDMGTMFKIKQYLIRRWTSQLRNNRAVKATALEDGLIVPEDETASDTHSVVTEGLAGATELLVVPATPAVEARIAPMLPEMATHDPSQTTKAEERLGPITPGSALSLMSSMHRRSSSAGRASNLLVEEEDYQWLSERGKQGKQWAWRTSSSRDRSAHRSPHRHSRSRSRNREPDDKEKDTEHSDSSTPPVNAATETGPEDDNDELPKVVVA
ncbi:conserved hypothetical protein [Microsporum canis CBS 113480]|uniref:Uncharacterized protein n=1 Tax=Arthroderma otae (strain ATCC MYA-4605 / CBS 113480) TaxID=554155 RepID=C5FZM4_ARTOC|nr:conserved hypothetical protein [Microsporum canis CBS 113480]EEQ35327.1 conserved hypothetical protein [Microsporum canis CBS 113480]